MSNTQEIVAMPLESLVADKYNPRQEFIIEEMVRLEESVSKRGILNPLLVEAIADGKYLIVDGERRYRVASRLGLTTVPVRITPESLTDKERLLVRFNLQEVHSPWTVWDKSVAVAELQALTDWNTTEIASQLGVSRSSANTLLALQKLSKRAISASQKAKLPSEAVAKIGLTVKNLHPDKATAIEEAFCAGVDSGKIFSKKTVNRFLIAAKSGTVAQLRKFSEDKDYATDNILLDNHAEHKVTEGNLITNVTSGAAAARKMTKFLSDNPTLKVSERSVDKATAMMVALDRYRTAASGRIEPSTPSVAQ